MFVAKFLAFGIANYGIYKQGYGPGSSLPQCSFEALSNNIPVQDPNSREERHL